MARTQNRAASDATAVRDTAAALDLDQLRLAIDAVVEAGRADIYGVGASGLVAQDLQQKLHRIGLVAFAWTDTHLAITSGANLRAGDVAIGISHTGTTQDTIDALAQARSAGARTIAVTNFANSPIAAAADLLLCTSAQETAFRAGAMGSRDRRADHGGLPFRRDRAAQPRQRARRPRPHARRASGSPLPQPVTPAS